jgi:hypothetical protein
MPERVLNRSDGPRLFQGPSSSASVSGDFAPHRRRIRDSFFPVPARCARSRCNEFERSSDLLTEALLVRQSYPHGSVDERPCRSPTVESIPRSRDPKTRGCCYRACWIDRPGQMRLTADFTGRTSERWRAFVTGEWSSACSRAVRLEASRRSPPRVAPTSCASVVTSCIARWRTRSSPRSKGSSAARFARF